MHSLVCIINVWDDWELAYHQYDHLSKNKMVDHIIFIYSEYSNYFELSKSVIKNCDATFINYEPNKNLDPATNERNKRNAGLQSAKALGFTHFILTDSDEYYEPVPFLKEKERFLKPTLSGLVCASKVYFKSPKLTIGLDTTLVPFIHKITPEIHFKWNRNYPFAWIDNQLRIDPTRSLSINSNVEWSDIIMHHMSWIRKDFEKKIRNSTARANIERSTIRQDLVLAKEGAFCNFYKKTLMTSSVDFGIPDFNAHEIHQKPVASSLDEETRNQ